MRKLFSAFALALFLLIGVRPGFAQDATVDPTLAVTEEAPVVEPPAEVTIPLDYLWSVQNLAQYAVIVSGVLGIVAVGGSLLLLNKQIKDAIEKVFMSAPPEHQQNVIRVVDFAENVVNQLSGIVRLLREVTDGEPNDDPPTQE